MFSSRICPNRLKAHTKPFSWPQSKFVGSALILMVSQFVANAIFHVQTKKDVNYDEATHFERKCQSVSQSVSWASDSVRLGSVLSPLHMAHKSHLNELKRAPGWLCDAVPPNNCLVIVSTKYFMHMYALHTIYSI